MIPKPHFPPPTPTTQNFSFLKFRHNKQLYHPYQNEQTVWPNISKIPLTAQNQSYRQSIQPLYGYSRTINSTVTTNSYKPGMSMHSEKISSSSPCSKFDDSMQIASNYLCNYFTNFQKVSPQKESLQQIPILSTVMSPSTTTSISDIANTTKTIFLPTPVPSQSIVTASNFVSHLPMQQHEDPILNIRSTLSTFISKPVEHQHTFFTIEDAITKATQINQVFNNPFEAYRHALNHQQHINSRGKDFIKTSKNSLFRNFFDDNIFDSLEAENEDDYSRLDNSYNVNVTPMSHIRYKNEHRPLPSQRVINSRQKFNLTDAKQFNSQRYNPTRNNTNQNFFTTQYNDLTTTKSRTTTIIPSSFEISDEKDIQEKITTSTTTEPTTTTSNYMQLLETTTDAATNNIHTTIATSTTTTDNKFNKLNFKRPYYHVLASAHKYQKNSRGPFKPLKNMTTSTTTSPSPISNKAHKYLHRQYKLKKNKHLKFPLKPSSTTTTTTTTSTTQSYPQSTLFVSTEKYSTTTSRALPTSTSSTKAPQKIRHAKQQAHRGKKVQSRNSKRILEPTSTKNPPEVPTVNTRGKNKSRRRSNLDNTPASTQRSLQDAQQHKITPPTQTATTTNRSTVRGIHRSESRAKHTHKLQTTGIILAESLTPHKQSSQHLETSTKHENVPPLPIEIYFKKSQHAKL